MPVPNNLIAYRRPLINASTMWLSAACKGNRSKELTVGCGQEAGEGFACRLCVMNVTCQNPSMISVSATEINFDVSALNLF